MSYQEVTGRGKGDIVAYGSILTLVASVSLTLLVISLAFYPDMSMKEFLDRNIVDSLDGDLKAYNPGDHIVVMDTISGVRVLGEYTYISLVSTDGTEYDGWEGLSLRGDYGDLFHKGDKIKLTLVITISVEDGREIFSPITPEDIVIL